MTVSFVRSIAKLRIKASAILVTVLNVKIMPKDNIRDYLDGNELDLSLHNLTSVPVKELVRLFCLGSVTSVSSVGQKSSNCSLRKRNC